MSDRGGRAFVGGEYCTASYCSAEGEKRYVDVVSLTTADGRVTPLEVRWEDGRRFEVDKVLDRRPARSLKTGGTGMRYTVRVGGRTTYLFYDDYRGAWFVEARR
jgi:hypothetical protein